MTTPIRMPNGVMDWLENGHTVTSQAEAIAAEAASRQGDPRSYERALERRRRAREEGHTVVRSREGQSPFGMIARAMGLTGLDEITIAPGDDTANPGASPCGHPPFCSCPTPDPTSRLNAGGGWDIARSSEGE